MRTALPRPWAARVNRATSGALAAGLVLLAVFTLRSWLSPASAPVGAERALQFVPLVTFFAAFVLTVALLASGSLPRERRARVVATLVLVVLAVAAAPMTFYHQLPDSWQRHSVHVAIRGIIVVAIGVALALQAPRQQRLLAALGVGGFAASGALRTLAAATGRSDASDVLASAAFILGLGAFAAAYALAATAPRSTSKPASD